MKFAAALATGRIAGTKIDPERITLATNTGLLDMEAIAGAEGLGSPEARLALYVAPEFQCR